MVYREKILKLLFLIVLTGSSGALAQDAAPVSPVRAALNEARELAAGGDSAAAVAALEELAGKGFTAVGVITGDEVLGQLAGDPDFDALVAEMSVRAYPCEHDERFREFDFWVGDWDVHFADGRYAGHNVIESRQRGTAACGLSGRPVSSHNVG